MYAPSLLTALPLHASLDSPLPSELSIGGGTALFVAGTCFCPEGPIETLSVLLDGTEQPVIAHGMPRLDFFRSLHPEVDPYETGALQEDQRSADDPLLQSYRSGFWAIARIDNASAVEAITLGLRARLDDGRQAEAELAPVPVVSQPEPLRANWPEPSGGRVAICMATYNPPAALLERQLESIRAQHHRNWICVISDDCSDPEHFERLRTAIGGDERFIVSRSERRRGFYRNFERVLALAPADAEFVAMSDQDDRWDPDKLSTLLGAIGDAQLVYSDARIVQRDGTLLADSYWTSRRNNHSDLLSLLVANSVTGAASLLRRELLDYALPFPPAQFAHFHDHWVGLVALSLGEIEFVDRALYDYVQHGTASLGHAAATSMAPLAQRLANQRSLSERVRMWRLHYFVDICRLWQFATILLMRCGPRMSSHKRRVLERFLAGERSPLGMTTLAMRGARELVSRRPETLGAEWMLALALAWKGMLTASVRPRPQRRWRLDAVPPPTLALKPGYAARAHAASSAGAAALAISEKIAPLELAPADDAPARVNVLIPTIDLQHLFGGYIAKLNLALRLARRGMRVRIVTTDPVPPLPHSWRQMLESYSGLDGLLDAVEIAFGRGGAPLEVSRGDRFIASTWWTAHIAAAAGRALDGAPFVYLIQEYEPFTFPMGTYAALAEASYAFAHFALFSSELLREYFRNHGIGVYRAGADYGDAESVSFQNAITDVTPTPAEELARRTSRRLLFYARPEQHAARNMFELGLLALERAVEQDAFGAEWELNGIGTVGPEREVPLGGGGSLKLLPRTEQGSYAQLLRDHDVGLALMYTPHPSLVPIEMASAGMLTVTNTFENKTAERLAAISGNLIAAEPSVEAIAAALAEAVAGVQDAERRAAGAKVAWSRDWDQSLGEPVLERLQAALGLGAGYFTGGSSSAR